MATKAQLLATAKEMGVKIPASAKKEEIEKAIKKSKPTAKKGEEKVGEY